MKKFYLLTLVVIVALSLNAQPKKLIIQENHNSPVVKVVYSFDGQWIASSSEDNDIKIWHVASGKLVKTFDNKNQIAKSLAFHPKKNTLLSTSGNKILIWNIYSGKIIGKLEKHTDEILSVNFSKDGRYIVSGGKDETVIVWNYQKKRKLKRLTEKLFYSNTIYDVKFSNNGSYVFVAGEDIFVKMWNWKRKRIEKRFAMHEYKINAIAINSDNTLLASASNDYTINIWDIRSSKLIGTLERNNGPVTDLCFLNDKDWLVASYYKNYTDSSRYYKIRRTEGHLMLWNINRMHPVWDIRQEGGFISLDIHPEKQTIIACDNHSSIREFQLKSGKVARKIGIYTQINDVVYSAQAQKMFVAGKDGVLKIWNLREARIVDFINTGIATPITAIAYNEEKKLLLTANQNIIKLWHEENDGKYQLISTFNVKKGTIKQMEFIPQSNSVIISRNCSYNIYQNGIARLTAYKDGVLPDELKEYRDSSYIEIWNPYKGIKEYCYENISGEFAPLAILPQNKSVYYIDEKRSLVQVKIDDFKKSPQILISLKDFSKNFMTQSLQASTLTMRKKEVKNIKRTTLDELFSQKTKISVIKFSNNEKYIAYGGNLSQVILWNNEKNKLERFGNFIYVNDITFSNNDELIAIANNNRVEIYDLATKTKQKQIICASKIVRVFFEKNNNRLITVGEKDAIRIWNLNTKEPIIRMINVDKKDFVTITNDLHYVASIDGIMAIGFSQKNNYYALEQFKLIYNRPDIVAQKIGLLNNELIEFYKGLLNNQINSLDFKPEKLTETTCPPKIEIIDKDKFKYLTFTEKIPIEIYATDREFNLDRIVVKINGIIVKNISLKKQPTEIITKKILVNLSLGYNNVEISCFNECGVESLKENLEIIYQNRTIKKTIYFFAICNHNDKQHAHIAQQEINKITANIKLQKEYDSIYIDTIFSDFSTDYLEHIKNQTADAGINDKIIVYVSGIGVADENFQYYLKSTHESKSDIPVKDIEGVFNQKVRDKVLVLDLLDYNKMKKENTSDYLSSELMYRYFLTLTDSGLKREMNTKTSPLEYSYLVENPMSNWLVNNPNNLSLLSALNLRNMTLK